MRNLFSGYYRPTEEQFGRMWSECTFAFDANVLLNVYRYAPATRSRLFDILRRLRERIWIPYQAAHEYHQNRMNVISQQFRAYDVLEKQLNKSLQELETKLKECTPHPVVDINQLTQIIRETTEKAKSALQEAKQRHPDLLAPDDSRDAITDLFDGRVGAPYSDEELARIFGEAKRRISQQIPPGYRDTEKSGSRQYSDVVLWFQLIVFAQSQRTPLIFITDDSKEDWWLQHEGKTIGPRPELRQEMLSKAGVDFYMYQTDTFMDHAQRVLGLGEQKAAVEEAKAVRQRREAQLQYLRDEEIYSWVRLFRHNLAGRARAEAVASFWEKIQGSPWLLRKFVQEFMRQEMALTQWRARQELAAQARIPGPEALLREEPGSTTRTDLDDAGHTEATSDDLSDLGTDLT